MALFSYKELEDYQRLEVSLESDISLEERASNYVTLDRINFEEKFDIFLSHSYSDKKIIPALKDKLEKMDYSVYVDWITDKLLSRNEVNKRTAEILQKRMKNSKCLIYATSDNSQKSRWMPWELGYFDGIKTKMVGILPIKKDDNNFKDDFKGEEYLGLYFYIDKTYDTLYLHENSSKWVKFKEWLEEGKEPS